MNRVYLDYNATAPLREEARGAMMAAMDVVGNPSSVHAEGRAAKLLVEKARGQVAALVGCDVQEVVFTSGATEAMALATSFAEHVYASEVEHDCVLAHGKGGIAVGNVVWDTCFKVEKDGRVKFAHAFEPMVDASWGDQLFCIQAANSETGICQPSIDVRPASVLCDIVQAVGRVSSNWMERADFLLLSAHKLGGPKGVGALIVAGRSSDDISQNTPLRGGGQEMGRRSGTENVIGIAGFGAAAEAAQRDLEAGVWDEVKKLRKILEKSIVESSSQTIFVGTDADRLPNTSCFITPGWKGETQVMAMDLAGFAISAGSACSSGKVKPSRVLSAMGFSDVEAASAVRVSLGPQTTEDEVRAFAAAWTDAYEKFRARQS